VGRWVVKDEGSLNGVYVNGLRTSHNLLCDGVRLAFGGVQVVFQE
jgi:pSer/pThr/pTyr-binding forkhead associated (FHA) protein